MKRSKLFLLTAALGTLLAAMGAPARAGDNDGQADLDKAMEKKLAATTSDDLGEVLTLSENAIKKGLNATNLQFANDLYNSTLLQRGTFFTQRAFEQIERGMPAAGALKDRESALADLEKLVSRDPKEGSAYLMIARLQSLRKQDHPAALKAADKAIELIKDEPSLQAAALVVRAKLQTDPEKELADFDAAVKLVPTDSEALWGRALLLVDKKKYEPALADLDALAKEIPKNLDGEENLAARAQAIKIHEARGFVLFQLKRNDQALASFEESIKLQPNQSGPYVRRALIRAELKDFKGALDDLGKALAIDPDSSVVRLTRARVYQLSGDLKSARADVDIALKNNNPAEMIEGLELRASISAEERDFDQATKDLEELAKIAPKNTSLLLQIGMIYAANKQSRKAIEKYDAALAIDDKPWQL
jgi:tetratricopeptide (TPR) repeat protein